MRPLNRFYPYDHANELVGTLHDGMPVKIRRDDYDFWLDPDMRSIIAPFRPTISLRTP
jgi:putative SOS response-associated peptidase YedK